MAKLKVYELARQLNMTNKVLLEILMKLDLPRPAKSHMSSLDEEVVEIVINNIEHSNDSANAYTNKNSEGSEGIDTTSIVDTVARILSSLDRRFEKETELYVSNQQVQQIKEALRDENVSAIVNWERLNKYPPEILARVVSQNAWLLGKIEEKEIGSLITIYQKCRNDVFMNLALDIIQDKVDTPLALKQQIELLYYERGALDNCVEKLESKEIRQDIALICVQRRINDMLQGRNVYRFLKTVFNDHKTIKRMTFRLKFDHLSEDEQHDFLSTVFDEEIISTDNFFPWETILLQFKIPAFNLVWNYMTSDYQRCKYRVKKNLIPKFYYSKASEVEYYMDTLIRYYATHEWIRKQLIEECVLRIRDKSVKEKLLVEMKSIGIPPETVFPEDDSSVINSVDKFYEEILSSENYSNTDGRIRWLVECLHEQEASLRLFKSLLYKHADEESIQTFAEKYLKIKAKNKRPGKLFYIAFDYCKQIGNDRFKERLLSVIRDNQLDDENIRKFVQEHDFELYRQLFGR